MILLFESFQNDLFLRSFFPNLVFSNCIFRFLICCWEIAFFCATGEEDAEAEGGEGKEGEEGKGDGENTPAKRSRPYGLPKGVKPGKFETL